MMYLAREGCRSFRRAFASIWRIRSLVTWKITPTSSSVRGLPSVSPYLTDYERALKILAAEAPKLTREPG